MEFLLSVSWLAVRYFDVMTASAHSEEFERFLTLAKKVWVFSVQLTVLHQ